MISFRIAPAIVIALMGLSLGACSKPNTDVQYGEPVSVRLTPSPGRPQMEMAFAISGGHQVSPGRVGDALVRIARACPEIDSLTKTEGIVRLRLKVQSKALYAAETPSEPLASCAAKAIEGMPFSGVGDAEFALAEFRAAPPSQDIVKGEVKE